jgi:hypothetical protein
LNFDVLRIGPHVTALPVVHGSGDFAWEVRRWMLACDFDCLAVPLPPSFQAAVCRGVIRLPHPMMVIQPDCLPDETPGFASLEFSADTADLADLADSAGANFGEDDIERILESMRENFSQTGGKQAASDPRDRSRISYVPVDPCQPVIAAIRVALGDHLPIQFIDQETSSFENYSGNVPDAYALKRLPIERYAAAVIPSLQAPESPQWRSRIQTMAWNLRQLSVDYKQILFVVGIQEWPWVRQAFFDRELTRPDPEKVHPVQLSQLTNNSLYFFLGELPFITSLYEKARSEMGDEANLNIDGVKELLVSARDSYRQEYRNRARKITPKLLSQILKYTRNLSLIENRFTPQLVDIVTASQQIAGDGYALQVLEQAKKYDHLAGDLDFPTVSMSLNRVMLENGMICTPVSRLPGPPLIWKDLQLIPRPDRKQIQDWQMTWNPHQQCSWPPEDELIENFRQTVFERAKEMLGADLVQTEKFTTSIRDGIDIRETVRHWYDNEIHVKILPPTRGTLDVAVILFDSPADPRDYPWRTTWFAEHPNESTLAFYGTDFSQQPVGPGICLATYGGVLFIFPPVQIPDIWHDPRLDFASTMEERLLAAACLYSQSPQIALVSSAPPGIAWRQLAKKFKKSWIHLPLGRFSDSTVQQLRMVHVLNGQHIRSYAANFIRRV